jgi:holo-[acyl-carrier protein] synthase
MEIGIDIVEISRIRALYEQYGRKFLQRILTESEIAQCLEKPDVAASIAGRFAAKEAVSKAVGSGISGEVTWNSIEIINDASGKPLATFRNASLLERFGHVRVSISHDRHSAVAMAVIEER